MPSMTTDHRQGIACGGIWVVDLVKVIDHYPQENSIAYISEMSRGGGGCGHNVVIDLAKFDANLPLYALGVIGNDAYGDYLVEECRRFPNINVDQLRRTDLRRHLVHRRFQHQGQRTPHLLSLPGNQPLVPARARRSG